MNFGRIRIPNNICIFKNDEYEYEYYSEFEKLFEYYSIKSNIRIRGTVKSKAPLRVQFSPALGERGGGKGLKPKLLLGFTK